MTAGKAFTISAFEDRLSRFFSGRPGLCRFLGNLETKLSRDKIEDLSVDRPIYVTGLARSGSTILLELLAAHDQTAAHQYRDYPLACILCGGTASLNWRPGSGPPVGLRLPLCGRPAGGG